MAQALELEGLFDEFAEAQALDPRRARAIAALILDRGRDSGLLKECAAEDKPPEEALLALDAWLCDLKDMRIGDGLHVFGQSPESADGFASGLDLDAAASDLLSERVAASGAAELLGLLRALGGQFVPPGPAGAPARGRLDVLPTGRNLYAIDPRSAPTRNAWEIGRRAAEEICKRYAQDHGEWPKRIVLDLWGSATMRTGGDDLAQAFALIGCRPTWDAASTRVNGFELLPLAMLGRPRVDVTLRISGLFRDVFPSQIALFAAAVRAVAALEESSEDNPLAGLQGAARIFGAAPGSYGVGLGARIARGDWTERSELAEAYLKATSHAYDGEGDAREAAEEFRSRVAGAEAFVHVQDLPGQDALDADAFAEHEGGFAAAAAEVGANPALYHLDSTAPAEPKIRTLAQEIARALRGRAANPRWLQGQMRHGHRGAAEIAQSLDNLYCFAALTDAVASAQFDLMFDATSRRRHRCARFFSAPIVKPHVTWRISSSRPRGAASGFRGAIRARAFWLRCSRRRHERNCAASQRLNPRAAYRKGWCPGALRPMETGDGLLARVRAPRGRLSLDQAGALADAALRCGNGIIGLSARANLHLRGLSERTLPDLHARLEDAGLIDADPEVERLRNIVASPLDDLDPEASFDLGESVAALETRLRDDERLRRLPPKFSFVVDAQGRLPLGDVDADIRFDAVARWDVRGPSCGRRRAGGRMRVRARPAMSLRGSAMRFSPLRAAVKRRRGGCARWSNAKAPRRSSRRRLSGRSHCKRSQQRPALREILGAHAYGAKFVVGAAAPFGEIDQARFKALIERARVLGASGLRLTPWRALLIVGLDQHGAESLVETIAELGLIVDAGDPRLRVAACPGAPACAHGLRPVRADATDWARMLPKGEGVVLHVSGCAKGCARPAATAMTVTATATGYDLILDGRAGDPPARRDLSSAEVAQFLASEDASLFAGAGPT